jgi:hypothetical protein
MNNELKRTWKGAVLCWFKVGRTVPVYLWRDLGEARNMHEVAGLRTELWTQDLPNSKRELMMFVNVVFLGNVCLQSDKFDKFYIRSLVAPLLTGCHSGSWIIFYSRCLPLSLCCKKKIPLQKPNFTFLEDVFPYTISGPCIKWRYCWPHLTSS